MCLVIDLSHANVSRGEYSIESKKVYVNHIFILSTVIKVSLKFFNRFYFFLSIPFKRIARKSDFDR